MTQINESHMPTRSATGSFSASELCTVAREGVSDRRMDVADVVANLAVGNDSLETSRKFLRLLARGARTARLLATTG